MIEAPIFHVNGDDPEAVVHVVKVAVEFRQKFHKPVVIDMFCYRRFGHNEGDEPAFTQPLMYERIRAHPTTLQIYAEKLVKEGVVTEAEVDEMKARLAQEARRRIRCRPAGLTSPTRRIGSTAAGRRCARPIRWTKRAAARPASPLPSCANSATASLRRAGGLPSPQDDPAFPRHAQTGDRIGPGHRLGDGRGSGLREPARRGLSGPPLRTGQRARHLLAAPSAC